MKKRKHIFTKILIIAVPTYGLAILTEKMIYTIPMLAITTFIAANLFEEETSDIRVDEDSDGGDTSITHKNPD